MSYKRSRATFEADHHHAPYATFGTPLPEEDGRDDGAYLPVWKQDVRDERGRRRLHGAFTGGFSAGYFNTVGSKEGWTPSTFVSSRTDRRKKDDASAPQQRPEDYMDDEDLEDAAEAQKLQTSQAFAGLGSSTKEELRAGGLMGLFRAEGDTMGLKLLRRMGWKDGQGIGPKVRRGARLNVGKGGAGETEETHLFAPDDVAMIGFIRKTDRKGLGHQGESKLSSLQRENDRGGAADEDEPYDDRAGQTSLLAPSRSKPKAQRGGIGMGILNDTGSDDEDPYEIGPKIKYNRVIGADKKKKKKAAVAPANPTLRNAPVFVPKTARAGNGLRRCHDGRLPLDGFVLASLTEDMSNLLLKYEPPPVPPGWKSAKKDAAEVGKSAYVSAADAAKASNHDPRSRAAMLGEKALPGKSVFDFLSSSVRDKLATASGRSNLPPGLGEIPEGFAVSEEERQRDLWDSAPKLDRETAIAALSRGSTGPYSDDEAKRARYRNYLEYLANPDTSHIAPGRIKGMTADDFTREMNEFYNCARIFKPMTGFMASRFTTAKNTSVPSSEGNASTELLSKPEPKVADPAEEAAKMGMFGKMTRSTEDFFPTRLLCKRFNVRAPAHVRPDNDAEGGSTTSKAADTRSFPYHETQTSAPAGTDATATPIAAIEASPVAGLATASEAKVEVNPEKNDAVEGKTAHADVLRAIFGDSDSD